MDSVSKRRVIVIGGGAAGLLASGAAAKFGAKVILLEKMARPGRKLRITGKGRCNLTNVSSVSEFLTHYGHNGKFLIPSFKAFFSNDLLNLLHRSGLATTVESDGRIFPTGGDARDVVDSLLGRVEKQKVDIKVNSAVSRLIVEQARIAAIETISGKQADSNVYQADAVILATGGKSYPATGSTGDGYRLAEEAGHTIVPVRPALVPLETKGDIASRLEGVGLSNISAKLIIEGKKRLEDTKEVMFTSYGLSGPAVLSLSKHAVDALAAKQAVEISIDLKPRLDSPALDRGLIDEIKNSGKKHYKALLKSLLPAKMVPVFCELTGVPDDTPLHQITSDQRKTLRNLLKDFRFEITGHRGFNEAVITAGGVSLREINPVKLESKIVKGLYFAGEVMDIDADTGGYNLQAAFSTGYLAGKSAALS